jgi:hypothetical protein
MKFIKDLSKLHIIPLVIGLVFLIALVVVLATTVMLRKDLIHEDSLQLAGKYKDRFGASFVGSETCKKTSKPIRWQTSVILKLPAKSARFARKRSPTPWAASGGSNT